MFIRVCVCVFVYVFCMWQTENQEQFNHIYNKCQNAGIRSAYLLRSVYVHLDPTCLKIPPAKRECSTRLCSHAHGACHSRWINTNTPITRRWWRRQRRRCTPIYPSYSRSACICCFTPNYIKPNRPTHLFYAFGSVCVTQLIHTHCHQSEVASTSWKYSRWFKKC